MLPDVPPAPRTPAPSDAPAVRWGVIGCGRMAEDFIRAVGTHTKATVTAVCGETMDCAQDLADRLWVANPYSDVMEFVLDDAFDLVFICSPYSEHCEHASLALKAGKHVVIVPPVAATLAEMEMLHALAAERGLLLLEAATPLFLPKFDSVRQLLEQGSLGRILSYVADSGVDADAVMAADNLGSSRTPIAALSIEALTILSFYLGTDFVEGRALAIASEKGGDVPIQVGASLVTSDHVMASVCVTGLAATINGSTVVTEEGVLVMPSHAALPGPWMVVVDGDDAVLTYDETGPDKIRGRDGIAYVAAEAARCVAAGETGSPLRPFEDSLATMRLFGWLARMANITPVGQLRAS